MITWTQIVEKYIGKPYQLCGWGSPGYDCFSVLVSMMRDSGVIIPQDSEWKGVKLIDYAKLWEEDKNKARTFIVESLSQYLTKDNGPIQQGSILLLTCGSDTTTFLGLHISNRIISSIKLRGVKAFPAKYFTIHNNYKVIYESA